MTRANPTRAPLLLLLLISLIASWLPTCFGNPTSVGLALLVPRLDRYRGAQVSGHRGQATTTIACVHHAGGAAAAGPLWLGRSSTRRGPPALWGLLCAAGVVVVTSSKLVISHLANDNSEEGAGGGSRVGAEENIKSAMISFIKAYKKELSPLMPPACRFLPTCSVYGVEAIEKFGPTKGAVLTVWRLMRCNPFAGYGVDHPQWPPPGWFAGEKW